MGIEPLIGSNNECFACFDLDSTPDIIYAEFINIEKGANWAGGMPLPPNGLYELPHIGTCNWGFVKLGLDILFQTNQPGTRIALLIPGLALAFEYQVGVPCIWHADSQLTEPPNLIYKNGSVQATWV